MRNYMSKPSIVTLLKMRYTSKPSLLDIFRRQYISRQDTNIVVYNKVYQPEVFNKVDLVSFFAWGKNKYDDISEPATAIISITSVE